jgi:hypothetical protein
MLRALCILACLAAVAVPPATALALYACDDTSLYTVDPTTGAATLMGVLNPPVTGLLGGLEMADGILYGLACTPGNALWVVDPATAATTQIGSGLGVGSLFEGGLAFDGENLWGVNQGVMNNWKNLIRIDRETGTAVVVGRLGDGDHDMNGLAFANGELYGIDRVTNALWNIDRTDPTLSYQVGYAFGGGIDLGVKGGMAGEYGYADDSHQIFRIDFGTGVALVLCSSAIYYRSFAPMGTSDVPADGAQLWLETIEPNPTPDATTVRLVLPRPARLTLAVHDAAGRRVRTLAAGSWAAGSCAIAWDGRDAAGRVVPEGVYFLRGAVGESPLGGKVVIVR